MKGLFLIIFIPILLSCSSKNVEYDYPSDPQNERKNRAGQFFDGDVVLYGKKEKVDNINRQVSAGKLFLSAKSVISELIDIDVIDPDLGIISTKWKNSKDAKERTKITALIKGKELIEDNINISIHKKQLDDDGNWKIKKSQNEDLVIKLLKSKIVSAAK